MFLNWWSDDLSRLNESDVHRYMLWLANTPYGHHEDGTPQYRHVNTLAKHAGALRVFLAWLEGEGYTRYFLGRCLTEYREVRRSREIPTDIEYRRYFLLLADEPIWHRSLKAVWASTGLRVSEILGLRITDVDRQLRALSVLRKGGYEALIPVVSDAWELLTEYLAGRYICSEDDPLWVTELGDTVTRTRLNTIERRLREEAGWRPEVYGYHVLRHKYMQWLAHQPLTPDELQSLSGNLSPQILQQTYAHISPDSLQVHMAAMGMDEIIGPEDQGGMSVAD